MYSLLAPLADIKPEGLAAAVPAPEGHPADPSLSFLLRASARYELVVSGEMDPEDAISGLEPAFRSLRPCVCKTPECNICGRQPCPSPSFCDACRRTDARKRGARR